MNKKELIRHLKEQDFSKNILNAFEKVKREDFISKEFKESAYEDIPLPIGFGQTISQPYTIAFMLNLLELDKLEYISLTYNKKDMENKSIKDSNKKLIDINEPKILEIGSGSGYVLALINEISKNAKIYGVERLEGLVEESEKRLKNKKNIKIICGDGSKGLKEFAPYDRILISASADKFPSNIYTQLKDNGVIVCVIENSIYQIKKKGLRLEKKEYPGFIFVPLVGD